MSSIIKRLVTLTRRLFFTIGLEFWAPLKKIAIVQNPVCFPDNSLEQRRVGDHKHYPRHPSEFEWVFMACLTNRISASLSRICPQIIFTKKYVSLNEVNRSILPGYRISGDKWLFQRLTETFDKKLMQALGDHNSFPDGVLSINMNVSSIFSKNFDKFIAKQKKLSDHPLILEIALVDIMSDLTQYYKAQEKLDKLGCKICICNMDIQSLYVLNRELINVDFLKVSWSKNYLGSLTRQDRARVSQAIKAQGKMRVVLSNCDSKDAFSFGNEIGIVMYQGFEVDKLQSIL